MSDKLNLIGKSREDIAKLVARKRHDELVDLLFEHASLEPHFSPKTVARARGLSPRRVVKMCQDGTMPGTHKPLENGWRISLSGLRKWDQATLVTPASGGNGR